MSAVVPLGGPEHDEQIIDAARELAVAVATSEGADAAYRAATLARTEADLAARAARAAREHAEKCRNALLELIINPATDAGDAPPDAD